MAKEIAVTTKKLTDKTAEVNMRVQVNNHREYHGQLGTIIEINGGCACADGWCNVLLDQDEIEERFRFGKKGDISDLLEVLTEPPRPVKVVLPGEVGALVSPDTVKTGLKVRIQPKSKFRDQSKQEGKITRFDDTRGWVRVSFDGGYSNVYRYGHKAVDGGTSDLVIV